MRKLILQTNRLMVGTWKWEDLHWLSKLNGDPMVMKYFPNTLNISQSKSQLKSLMEHYQTHQFTYFPVFLNQTGEPIGFVGLKHQHFVSKYTPAIDLGYRLFPKYWGKGYATEAAEAILSYAPNQWNTRQIIAVTPKVNVASQKVMKRLDMKYMGSFMHPNLTSNPEIQECMVFQKGLFA